jgi:hypothetical protein
MPVNLGEHAMYSIFSRKRWFANGSRMSERRRRRTPGTTRLALEWLEDRIVPSPITINWWNRGRPGDDRDHFEQCFGAGAEQARACVQAAVDAWQNAIVSFNYADPSRTMAIKIEMGGDSATGAATGGYEHDDQGKPTEATITINKGFDDHGQGWFVDGTPYDNSEFQGGIINAYAAFATPDRPASRLDDLYTTVLQEMAHAMGFNTEDDELWRKTYGNHNLSDTGIGDTFAPKSNDYQPIPGTLWTYNSQNIQALYTSDNGGHEDRGFALHTAEPTAGNIYTHPPTGKVFYGVQDAGNAYSEPGVRYLVSRLDLELLNEVYGFTVNLDGPNFYAMYDPQTLAVNVHGGSHSQDIYPSQNNPSNDTITVNVNSDGAYVFGVQIGNPVPGTGPNSTYSLIVPANLVHAVNIYPDDGINVVSIRATAIATITTIHGTGQDTVNIAPGTMGSIRGNVVVNSAHVTTLNIDDTGDDFGTSQLVEITDHSVTFGKSSGQISYYGVGLAGLNITTSNVGNTVNVYSTTQGPVTSLMSRGADTVTVGAPVTSGGPRTVGMILGGLRITNPDGGLSLVVDDSADYDSKVFLGKTTAPINGLIYDDLNFFPDLPFIQYYTQGTSSASITTGPSATVTVSGVRTPTTLNLGANATFNVGDHGSVSLDADLTVKKTTGGALINVDNTASSGDSLFLATHPATYPVDKSAYGKIGGLGTGTLLYRYADTANVTVTTSANIVTVSDTGVPTTLNVVVATVNVGDQGVVGHILAPVTVTGTTGTSADVNVGSDSDNRPTTVTVDQDYLAGLLYDVVTFAVHGTSAAAVKMRAVTSDLRLQSGAGLDTINLEYADVPVTLALGTGNDVVNLSPFTHVLDNIADSVKVDPEGSRGPITMVLNNQASHYDTTWTITDDLITRAGSFNDPGLGMQYDSGSYDLSYVANVEIHGGDRADNFTYTPSPKNVRTHHLSLDGGLGNNTIAVDDHNDPYVSHYSLTPSDWTITHTFEQDSYTDFEPDPKGKQDSNVIPMSSISRSGGISPFDTVTTTINYRTIVAYSDVAELDLYAGKESDTITVAPPPDPSITVLIDGGAGTDSLAYTGTAQLVPGAAGGGTITQDGAATVNYRSIETGPTGQLTQVLTAGQFAGNGQGDAFWLGYVNGKPTFQVNKTTVNSNVDLAQPVQIDGGADGAMLTIDYSGGPFPIINFTGGPRNSSFLLLRGGTFQSVRVSSTSATAGTVDLDGATIDFSGVSFVSDWTTSADFSFDGTDVDDDIHLIDGNLQNGVQCNLITSGHAGAFDTVEFANQRRVNIHGLGGNDTITNETTISATGLQKLRFRGEVGDDKFYLRGISPANGTVVIPGDGDNSVYVLRSNAALHVYGAGTHDSVVLGTDGTSRPSMANIQGDITIDGAAMSTDVSVNYLWDGGKKLTIDQDSITGLGASLSFDPASLRSLTVQGGIGSNSFTVMDTPNNFLLPVTALYGGYTDDTWTVAAISGQLEIHGGGGKDAVNLGSDGFGHHSIDNINGTVTMSNSGTGSTALTIDDTFGYGKTMTLTPTAITTGARRFDYEAANLRSLTLNAAITGDTITVNGTPTNSNNPVTTLNTGFGDDQFTVNGTGGRLQINNGSGYDSVTIGGPLGFYGPTSLVGIQGSVTIANDQGSAAVTIDDSYGGSKTATLSATGLTGMSHGDIRFTASALRSLTIIGSYAGNTFTVAGTPNDASTPVTTLHTGRGIDRVSVLATQGELHIDGDDNTDTVMLGGLPPRSTGPVLSGIHGAVTVRNTLGTTNLILEDVGDRSVRPNARIGTYVRSAETFGQVTNLGNPAAIAYRINDGNGKTDLSGLTISAGSHGNTIAIDNANAPGAAPFLTTLNSGAGPDTVTVQAVSANNPLQLNGQGSADVFEVTPGASIVTIDGSAPTASPGDTLHYHGSGTVTHTGIGSGKITQDGVAPVSYTGIESVGAVGGTLTDNVDAGGQAGDGHADTFRVVRERSNVNVYVNGRFVFGVPATSTNTLALIGSSDADTLIVDGSGGNPAPLGGLSFDGKGGTNIATFNDQTNAAASVWQISDKNVTRTYTDTTAMPPATVTAALAYANVQSLTVNCGRGNQVNVASLSAATTVNTGAGNDNITAGAGSNRLDGLTRSLTVNAGAGTDVLTVNDQANDFGSNYLVTSALVRRQFWGSSITIAYSGMERLALNTGLLNDTVALQSVGIPMALATGNGNDSVVTTWPNTVPTSATPLTIDAGSGTDSLSINDQANVTGGTYTVTTTGVTRNVSGTTSAITYQGMTNLVLTTGPGGDHVNVESTPGPTTVSTGDGADVVNVAGQARNLDVIGGTLTINGGIGSNQLQINDQANAHATTWQLTGTSIDRTYTVSGQPRIDLGITYSNIQTLAVHAGSGNDTAYVRGTTAATTVDIAGGYDTFNVGNAANRLDDVQGALTVQGGAGTNFLNVNDQGTTAPRQYSLTANTLTRSGAAQISYSGMTAFNLNGGSGTVNGTAGSSTFDFLSTSAPGTQVYTGLGDDRVNLVASTATSLVVEDGGGADTIVLGSKAQSYDGTAASLGGNLDGLTGGVTVGSYSGHLVVDDSGDTKAHPAVRLVDTEIRGLTPPGLIRYGAYTTDFYFGSGGNTITVAGTNDLGSLMDVHTGTGADTVTVAIANDTYYHTLRVDGQSDDALTIDDSALTNGYTYTLTDTSVSRVLQGSLIPTAISYAGVKSVTLRTGSGDDVFQVNSTPASIPLTVNGGTGNNLLDYSAYASAVTVNLATGQATGFTGGISNIAAVLGSAFADHLTGDGGRNVLIGNAGADVLTGGAGDDLLISGTTTYGSNVAALLAIVREWARTDATYAARVADLSNGGGLNGSYVLNATTLPDDGAVDVLTGGADSDWFLANAQDTLLDSMP